MDYTKRAALLCCTCYLVLLAISFIPPQTAFGLELRRANVLSNIVSFSEDNLAENVELVIDTEEYEVDFEAVEQALEAVNNQKESADQSVTWSSETIDSLYIDVAEEAEAEAEKIAEKPFTPVRLLEGIEIVAIENFDTVELTSLSRFYRKMLSPDSLVRIAVLGDSFIEADILTADLREALQSQYGGCGAGFAPMHSPLTQYRKTVSTNAKGWTSHNVMQHKSTPAPYNTLFPISGWVSLPSAGASTTWEASSARKHLDSCKCVKLHFLARNSCSVEVAINGGESRTFDFDASEALRQIELHGQNIRSVTMRVVKGHEGFVGYGAHFEGDRGVVVDNYSVRSNNGQAMFWTSAAINAQIDKNLGGYDLVILQYGLNIMQSGVNRYTSYSEQVEKMISYSKKCFPNAAVIVLGVSDRSTKKNGAYEPMSEAQSMTEYQRQAAENQGANFWSTYAAMQAQGGMSRFVVNGWAAKDYTHINFAGGKQVAWALVDAMNQGVVAEREKMVVKIEYEPIIDSLQSEIFQQQLSF
ncbi:MAG: hypothetical protein SNG49_08715 [Rikenellaceae bacterium]